MNNYRILQGDVRDTLKQLDDKSIQCCVTSPPYYGLRDYGTADWEGGDDGCEHNPQKADGGDRADRTLPLGRGGVYKDTCDKCGAIRVDNQIGLEESPEAYVAKLVDVFREVRRVLKDDGVCFINLGDSYAGSGGAGGDYSKGGLKEGQPKWKSNLDVAASNLKPKDLIGIPWMVAFALRADGWYLRQDIIWAKPNPMPESVKDRCTKSHEYIFLLTKNARYYYDNEAIMEPVAEVSLKRAEYGFDTKHPSAGLEGIHTDKMGSRIVNPLGRNKRSVWTVTTKSYKEAHFATFPMDLITPCILAGSKEDDLVLDPFSGSGTTGYVAMRAKRNYIGCELNPAYIDLSKKRFEQLGMFIEEKV